MASKCEDHMDLGGFLQTYVLGNPFQAPSLNESASPPNGLIKTATLPQRSLTPTKQCTAVNGLLNSKSKSPRGVTGTTSTSGKSKVEVSEPPQAIEPHFPLSPVHTAEYTCSLGHIGSNASYAKLLKKRKVADAHRPLQVWLLSNYKYSAEVPALHYCLYSSQILLKEVQAEFATMSSIVLSRVVKFTFPDCSKIINKSGTYWLGLLRRPQALYCSYIMAAKRLQDTSDWDETLKEFSLQSACDCLKLTGLLYWRDGSGQKLNLEKLVKICNKQGEKGQINPLDGAIPDMPVKLSSPSKRKRRSSSSLKFEKFEHFDNGEDATHENDLEYTLQGTAKSPVRGRRKRKKSTPVKIQSNFLAEDEEMRLIGEIAESDLLDSIMNSSQTPSLPRSAGSRSESCSPCLTSPQLVTSDSEIILDHPMDSFDRGVNNQHKTVDSGLTECLKVKEEPIDSVFEACNGKSSGNVLEGAVIDSTVCENKAVKNEVLTRDENENCDFRITTDTKSVLDPSPTSYATGTTPDVCSPIPYATGTTRFVCSPTPYATGTTCAVCSPTPNATGTTGIVCDPTAYDAGTTRALCSPTPFDTSTTRAVCSPTPYDTSDYCDTSPVTLSTETDNVTDPHIKLPNYVVCLSQNKHLKGCLNTQKLKLADAVKQNEKLSSDLEISREEIKSLNKQLTERDDRLAGLARDFLNLSDKFKQLSKAFYESVTSSIESNPNKTSQLLDLDLGEFT